MSTTKNGRIRKLIKHIIEKPMRITRNKVPECYIKINYYQLGLDEDNRRKIELGRLETALTGVPKKPRMRKFAHKKQQAKAEKAPKKGGKK